MTLRLTEPVSALWPAGTVLLRAGLELRWVCPDGSTGSARLKDAGWMDGLATEHWDGNFPELLMSALKTTSG